MLPDRILEAIKTLEDFIIPEEGDMALPALEYIMYDLDKVMEDITTVERLEEVMEWAETFFITVYPYKNVGHSIEVELSREQADKIVADIKDQINRHRYVDEDGVFKFVINVQRWHNELNFFPPVDEDED